MRVHDLETPFKCDEEGCGAEFAQSGHLYTHKISCHTEEGIQKQKKQEERVARALTKAGIDFKREHHIEFTCWGDTWARADFVIIINGGVVIVEVDEEQHLTYPTGCDVARMSKIHTAFALSGNTLPLGIIRYNPDDFKVDDKKINKRVCGKEHREAELVQVIKSWEFGEPGSLEIQYMYYDAEIDDDTGRPTLDIWKDPMFDLVLQECCRVPIIK